MIYPKSELEIALISLSPKLASSNNFQINCPECGRRECYISISKNDHPWRCVRGNKCGVSGYIKHLKKYGIVLGNKIYTPEVEFVSLIQEFAEENHFPVYKPQDNEIMTPCEGCYWVKRGIPKENDFFKCNVSPNYEYLGLKHKGKLIGYQGRYCKDDQNHFGKKYDGKFSLGRYIYGLDELQSTPLALIVEGIIDKHSVDRKLNLLDQNKIRCVSTYAANISDQQVRLLKGTGIKKAILMLDKDVFHSKTLDMGKKLNYAIPTDIAVIESGNDPDEASASEIITALKTKKHINEYNR